MKKKNRHIGSPFSKFLKDEGLSDEARTTAVKRVLAWQIEQAMKTGRVTKSEMARRMHTSRSQLDRLLDPFNDKVQLQTLQRAAAAIGKRLVIDLEDYSSAA
jgi:antitoxin HicB